MSSTLRGNCWTRYVLESFSARTEDLNSHFPNNCQYTKVSCSKLAVLEVISPTIKVKSLLSFKHEGSCELHLTCLLRVMALGWHFVQMPSGQGGCPSQPDLILQLMFSRATNFPLQEEKEKATVSTVNAFGSQKKQVARNIIEEAGQRRHGGTNALHLQRISKHPANSHG